MKRQEIKGHINTPCASRHLGVLSLKPKLYTILARGLTLQFATELMLEGAIRPQEQINCDNERERRYPELGDAEDDPSTSSTPEIAGT